MTATLRSLGSTPSRARVQIGQISVRSVGPGFPPSFEEILAVELSGRGCSCDALKGHVIFKSKYSFIFKP